MIGCKKTVINNTYFINGYICVIYFIKKRTKSREEFEGRIKNYKEKFVWIFAKRVKWVMRKILKQDLTQRDDVVKGVSKLFSHQL